jgi:uncharacterized membrane protein YhaH (DUF805 family)
MSAKVGLLEHFRKLASFSGREDRASFWPYAALVLGIVFLAGALMTLPMMAWLMQSSPQFAGQDPAAATFASDIGEFSMPAQVQVTGLPLPTGFLSAYLAVTIGLAVLLYAAAVFRRLHDRGRSGAWGLMPLPFLAYMAVQTIRVFGSVTQGEQPDMGLIFTIALSNILFWAALLALVVLLCGASDPGPNAYDHEG